MVLGPEAGPCSHVNPEHCTLAIFCIASDCFLAIYLSQTIWYSVPSTFSIVLAEGYIMRFIPQTGSGRPRTLCPEVEQSSPSFSLPTKPILQISPETRLHGRSICRSVTLAKIYDGKTLNAHGY